MHSLDRSDKEKPERSIMNCLGVRMASPSVFWEWRRTMAGVNGSPGFANSHLPSSERFFPGGIFKCWPQSLKNNLLSPSSRVSTKLFWNLTASSYFHLQSLIQVSLSPTWVTVYNLIGILPSALDVEARAGLSVWNHLVTLYFTQSEKKKKTLYWSKSPNQSVKFSLCLLMSLGSSLCPAPIAFLLFPQKMPVPRIPDHFLF